MKKKLVVILSTIALTGCGSISGFGVDESSDDPVEASAEDVSGTTTEPAPATTPPQPSAAPAATPTTSEPPRKTEFEWTQEFCELPASAVIDNGEGLVLDHKGTADKAEDTIDIDALACALSYLDTPESIVRAMDTTRMIDGRQTESANGLTYQWSYGENYGLDIIITRDGS
ncbi:hypothetical protein [Helcobacillus massiliensis]|uniref:Putative small secreted protein n=1 Tax=Helcobacillus massiliensis TaxID=521392 RepID=A0A839QTQ6_9MICO|nr:hypothetical protein [Helcobacillus massiliensis]MBB3023115.1 putative small secreted protein [Helcobacillus massiliensis]